MELLTKAGHVLTLVAVAGCDGGFVSAKMVERAAREGPSPIKKKRVRRAVAELVAAGLLATDDDGKKVRLTEIGFAAVGRPDGKPDPLMLRLSKGRPKYLHLADIERGEFEATLNRLAAHGYRVVSTASYYANRQSEVVKAWAVLKRKD